MYVLKQNWIGTTGLDSCIFTGFQTGIGLLFIKCWLSGLLKFSTNLYFGKWKDKVREGDMKTKKCLKNNTAGHQKETRPLKFHSEKHFQVILCLGSKRFARFCCMSDF